jgi:hypothetical protein
MVLKYKLRQFKQKLSPPWGKFFTSAPVWAIIAAHFAENWGFYTLLTQLPTFMRGKILQKVLYRPGSEQSV